MSFAGTLMTPRIDAKIRSSMFKNKKSNFKDILRERFRDQIRANRRTLFEKMRSLNDTEGVQSTLNDYLQGEMREFDVADQNRRAKNFFSSQSKSDEPDFDHDALLQLMKEIEVELLEEQYEWIMNEYRTESEEQINFYQSQSVACPICHLGILQKQGFVDPISCTKCNLRLSSSMSLEYFNRSLKQRVDEHTRLCSNAPEFILAFDGTSNALFMNCDTCSLFCSVD